MKRKCVSLGYDTSHFTGQGWSAGLTFDKKDLAPFLVTGGPNIQSHKLKVRLIRDGYKEPKCEICGLTKWRGKEVPLELDHINSNHFDNALENLQIICPNCHALETKKRAFARRKGTLAKLAKITKSKTLQIKTTKSKAPRAEWLAIQENRKQILLQSTIDFTKFGWVTKAAILLNMPTQKINSWIKRMLPELYANKCFKRKSTSTE